MSDAISILIVDDEPVARSRLRELLADLSPDFPHRIVGEAANAPEALSQIDLYQPQVVLLDVQMPGMTGIELAVASREVRPRLPVLLATGYADLPGGVSTDVPRLAKPYHQDQLRDRLEQLLG